MTHAISPVARSKDRQRSDDARIRHAGGRHGSICAIVQKVNVNAGVTKSYSRSRTEMAQVVSEITKLTLFQITKTGVSVCAANILKSDKICDGHVRSQEKARAI